MRQKRLAERLPQFLGEERFIYAVLLVILYLVFPRHCGRSGDGPRWPDHGIAASMVPASVAKDALPKKPVVVKVDPPARETTIVRKPARRRAKLRLVATGPKNKAPDRRDYGRKVADLDGLELRAHMEQLGFSALDGYKRNELRFIYQAWNYDAFLWRVHELSGLPVSVVWGYFVYEALNQGVETRLWAEHANPGGIKLRKGAARKVMAFDDCNGRPCAFSGYESTDQAAKAWAGVFNARRYGRCKGTPAEIIRCLQQSGYHTAKNWKGRLKMAEKYWVYRRHFPRGWKQG